MVEENQSRSKTSPQDNHIEEDEIDIAELISVLFRRWRWILCSTILIILLGTGYSFIQQPKYTFSSMVQIGKYQTSQNEYKFIQPPNAAAEHIKATARTIYNKRQQQKNSTDPKFSIKNDFKVEVSEQGGILKINLDAPKTSSANQFIKKTTKNLHVNHSRLFQVRAQKYEQRIQSIEAKLQELQKNIKSFKSRLQLLEKQKSYLKQQIDDSTTRINNLLQMKTTANLNNSQEPVGLLLFSSEIQRIRSYINKLENRLLSEIPMERESYQLKIENIRSQITTKKAELKSQKVALNNMRHTQTLLEPSMSNDPVSPNIKLHIALSLVLGVFAGVFLAFLREFWVVNRQRITGNP